MAVIDPERLLAFTRRLVRTRSTPGNEGAIIAECVREMVACGLRARVDAAGHAVGVLGQGRPLLLIDCHIDTIPLHGAERWRHDPLAAIVENGRLYGLGSCDMKGSAAAAVHGVAALAPCAADLCGSVVVVLSIAEEQGEGVALAPTVAEWAPEMVIIGEPSDLQLCIGQRGRARLEVTVRGVSCHAGHPTVGINALTGMSDLLRALTHLPYPTHPLLGPRTLTPIDIRSEPYPSVSTVPNLCVAHIDCRYGPDESDSGLAALVQATAEAHYATEQRRPEVICRVAPTAFDTYNGLHYEAPDSAPAWLTDVQHPLVGTCLAAMAEAGLAARTSAYRFCTNGSLTAGRLGIPTVGFGVGRESDAHSVDESIAVADLVQCAHGYQTIVRHLLGGGE